MKEQSATLEQALDALRSICQPPPAVSAAPLTIPTQPSPEVGRIPPCDPAEWRSPFVEWLDSQCALHQRAFGGLVSLHIAFCEWEHAQGGVPCTRETFAALLAELDFLMGEIEGTLLVSGLILKDDAAAYTDSIGENSEGNSGGTN